MADIKVFDINVAFVDETCSADQAFSPRPIQIRLSAGFALRSFPTVRRSRPIFWAALPRRLHVD